ncbi:choice-of-anchor E domain-containing protein [Duganella aceris]|uniref:PEP-CTERM sorting domain-containing protein n=1 Tax=Duganella aceris TaxID=2703883 RepID=A0ABX0FLN8_9BURK|nr:choice-of-anchor E domain-containing protein [Duganella aceris]NGZ85403.1 PEP-CTERM sorting domain-containing protein [Duganella aceris]
MKLNKLSQVLLAAACFASTAANAAVKTYVSTPVSSSITDLSDFLSFQQFNSAWGTLQSISITVGSTVTGTVDLIDLVDVAHAPQAVPVSLSVELFLQRPADASNILQLSQSVFDTELTLSGVANGTATQSGTVHLSATKSLDASDFALFTGSGYVYAPLKVNAISSSTGDDIDVQFTTYASGTASITYNYVAAVPEPETYGMMLLGMGVVAFAARRKSRSAQA